MYKVMCVSPVNVWQFQRKVIFDDYKEALEYVRLGNIKHRDKSYYLKKVEKRECEFANLKKLSLW